jgi:hypothetical protein
VSAETTRCVHNFYAGLKILHNAKLPNCLKYTKFLYTGLYLLVHIQHAFVVLKDHYFSSSESYTVYFFFFLCTWYAQQPRSQQQGQGNYNGGIHPTMIGVQIHPSNMSLSTNSVWLHSSETTPSLKVATIPLGAPMMVNAVKLMVNGYKPLSPPPSTCTLGQDVRETD